MASITKSELIRAVYPVTEAIAYGGGCFEFRRTAKSTLKYVRPARGKIRMQSRKSLLRLMFLMQVTEIKFESMLTLTYPKYFPSDGKIVKADVAALVQKLRRAEWKYLWFLEFQKRGAPHVHILVDADTVTPRMRVDFGLYWTARIALSDWFVEVCPPAAYDGEVIKMMKFNTHHQVWETIRDEDGARNYVAKYASKERQKTVPAKYQDVGRFWGSTRAMRPEGVTFDVTEDEIEEYLVDQGHPATSFELVPRYIWAYGNPVTSVVASVDA